MIGGPKFGKFHKKSQNLWSCKHTKQVDCIWICQPFWCSCFISFLLVVYKHCHFLFLFSAHSQQEIENKSKNFTSGVNSISLLTMATLSMNSSDFNEALTSFKTFAEAIFSGQDKSQKLRLCAMMKNLSIPMDNILPPELLEKIFKLLYFKDTCQANLICKRWKEIIVKGKVLKKASGKTSTK